MFLYGQIIYDITWQERLLSSDHQMDKETCYVSNFGQ